MSPAPDDQPHEGVEPAHREPGDEVDGEDDRVHVGVDIRIGDRVERACHSRIERRDPEGHCLVPAEADARRGGRHLTVANRLERAPGLTSDQQPRCNEQDERDAPGEVVHPVVRRGREPERRLGEVEDLAGRSAEEMVELLRQLRERHRDAEGDQREIEAGEAERRQADEQPGGAGDHAGDGDRPEIPDLMPVDPVHAENCRGVAADRHERAVAERDLAAVAGEDRQAEKRDEVHADDRQLTGSEIADEARQGRHDQGEHREAEELEHELGFHTRRTATRPKSPPGRTSSRTRISISAVGSFNVEPMKPT